MAANELDDVIDWGATSREELRFALELDPDLAAGSPLSHELDVRLRNTPANPSFSIRFEAAQAVAGSRATVVATGPGELRCRVDSPSPAGDDELALELVEAGSPAPLTIRIRRTRCRIETALIHPLPGGDQDREPLGDQVRAALLWYGYGRCVRLVGIKRFDTGLSGSEVFVFRPRLAAPRLKEGQHQEADFAGSVPPGLWGESWGSWLLVKANGARQVRKEWSRHDVFLRDRLTPFMARTEEMLRVRPAGGPAGPPARRPSKKQAADTQHRPESSRARSTLISSFLGGDLIRAEPLEYRLKAGGEAASCRGVLARAFETLAAWHSPGSDHELHHFGRFFKDLKGDFLPSVPTPRDGKEDEKPSKDTKGDFLLFGPTLWEGEEHEQKGYDLGDARHREVFGRKVTWDVAFQKEDHLGKHLLGKGRDGLLYKLMDTKVRYSLIHGDLNPRNILCDRDYAWLIDFEHAGYGPTLFDFAWLEANLRYFCLDLAPGSESLDEAATRFERHLLDHLHGGESSLEPVRRWAAELGADPDELHKLASAIVQVRQLALPYCVDEYADHRDYLAVLYLSVLSLLRGDRDMNAPPANYRALVRLCWVLEEQLSRIHGLRPFDSGRASPDLRHLVDAGWLRDPGAPGRVDYLVRSADGARVLGPVAATRGVQQGDYHHLDVYDHSLLVLAYVEALFEGNDPIAGLLDPKALDVRVMASLEAQRLRFPPPMEQPASGFDDVAVANDQIREMAREVLIDALGEARAGPGRLLLKWCALLHDVGKPGVRSMSADGKIHVIGHPDYGLQLVEGHLAVWFGKPKEEELIPRLRYLILRHHDHNNLAKKDHEAVNHLGQLSQFAIDPTVIPHERCQKLFELAEEVTTRKSDHGTCAREPRHDFPLLILQGFADSLASRGHHCPLPVARRADIYLVFLALWHRRGDLPAYRVKWELCRERATTKGNPPLAPLIATPKGVDQLKARKLGELPEWAWERVRSGQECPSPEEFVEEARSRIDRIDSKSP